MLYIDYEQQTRIYTYRAFDCTGVRNYIYKSSNGGNTWNYFNVTNPTYYSINSLSISRSDSQIIYAGTGNGIYKSTNGGSSWTKTSTTSSIYSLAVDPTDPRIVYAGTANGVYESIDGGNTLTQFFPGRSIGYLIIDPTNPQILYVSTIDTYDNNIFKTINQLTSIGKCNLDLDHTYRANALAINPNNPRIIYAGTNNGLYKTKNGCEKWVYIDLLGGIINSLAISSNNPEILYVGTDTGVYKVY